MSATGVLQAARTLSAAGTTYGGAVDLGNANAAAVALIVDVTAISGTGQSLALTVQWSNDGTRWADADPVDTFTAITAVGLVAKSFTTKGRRLRLKEVLAGTTPTVTYSASMFYAVNS